MQPPSAAAFCSMSHKGEENDGDGTSPAQEDVPVACLEEERASRRGRGADEVAAGGRTDDLPIPMLPVYPSWKEK